jgi:hypothetical protein
MLLLGNWGQQMDIEDIKGEIESLRDQQIDTGTHQANSLQSRIAQLEIENGELRLYLAALVRYLGNKSILQKDEFRILVETIDKEDNNTDGGYTGPILK